MKFIISLLLVVTLSFSQAIHQTAWVTSDGTTPIYILPFKGIGGAINSDKPWEVIYSDLDFAKDIKPVKINRSDLEKLMDKNIQLFVDGSYEVKGDSVILEISLNDINSGEMIIGKAYRIKQSQIRLVAHTFDNLIYKTLYGNEGPFLSKIIYTRRSKNSKNIFIMDFDGKNSHKLSRGGINITPCFVDDTLFLWSYYGRGKPDIYKGNIKTGIMKPFIYSRGIDVSPHYSPIRDKVVYASSRSGNSEIYTVDLDGKNREQVTFSGSIDASPSWSPNGYYISFVSDRSGSPQIYIMDYSGANVKRVTFNGSYHDTPVWSVDGDKIYYTARRDGKFDIYAMNIDDGDEICLTSALPGSNQYPTVSPDGSQIIFVNQRGKISNLYRVDINGDKIVPVTKTGDAEMPSWSFIKE